MISKFWFFFLVLFLSGCDQYQIQDKASQDLSSFSLENCQYVRNSKGQIVSWKSTRPISFSMVEKIPESLREIVKKAARAWTAADGSSLIHIKNDLSGSVESANDKQNVIYWDTAGKLFNNQQGQTVNRWVNNQMQDTDIIINGKDFSYFDDNANDEKKVHFESLMIHEFGHALGLKHTTDAISVMFPELAFLQVRTDLSEKDETSVKCEYP